MKNANGARCVVRGGNVRIGHFWEWAHYSQTWKLEITYFPLFTILFRDRGQRKWKANLHCAPMKKYLPPFVCFKQSGANGLRSLTDGWGSVFPTKCSHEKKVAHTSKVQATFISRLYSVSGTTRVTTGTFLRCKVSDFFVISKIFPIFLAGF